MEEKTLLEADTQEEEVLQGEALQMGVPQMMMTTIKINQMITIIMMMMRNHYHGNLPSDPLADHLQVLSP